MTKKIDKEKTIKFDSIDVKGVSISEITIKAPTFKQVRIATSHIKNISDLTFDELNELFEKFVIECGTTPSGPVLPELIENMDYKQVAELGGFCMGFM